MSIFHGLEESKIIEGGDVIDKGDSEESDHEGKLTPSSRYQLTPPFSVDGLKMFRAAKAPSSIKGVINYLTSRQMFAKSKDLVIMDGDYDIPHGSANARKGKSTAKNSQQGEYPGPIFSILPRTLIEPILFRLWVGTSAWIAG
jgi:hypothetical protein